MKNRLVVEIAEGLGNQLFMYANAFALSKKLNYELLIDEKSGYSRKKNKMRNHQKYMLDLFNIKQVYASRRDKYDNIIKRIKKKIELFSDKFITKRKFIIEKYNKINGKKITLKLSMPNKEKLGKNLYIQGHFEDQNYFINFRDDILKMFKPLDIHLKNNNELIRKLKNTNSVSIHIRMNRFTEQPHEKKNRLSRNKSNKYTIDLINYINKSVIYFEKKLDNPEFFIWSNDFLNINQYFDKKKFTYVNNNDAINDFNLFSYAKHFIVGASTFHWWGAWLNDNPNKICVCPKNINPSGNENFYPLEWKRI